MLNTRGSPGFGRHGEQRSVRCALNLPSSRLLTPVGERSRPGGLKRLTEIGMRPAATMAVGGKGGRGGRQERSGHRSVLPAEEGSGIGRVACERQVRPWTPVCVH